VAVFVAIVSLPTIPPSVDLLALERVGAAAVMIAWSRLAIART
jgi:hypothetical protein